VLRGVIPWLVPMSGPTSVYPKSDEGHGTRRDPVCAPNNNCNFGNEAKNDKLIQVHASELEGVLLSEIDLGSSMHALI
jgi:hypothetical protein